MAISFSPRWPLRVTPGPLVGVWKAVPLAPSRLDGRSQSDTGGDGRSRVSRVCREIRPSNPLHAHIFLLSLEDCQECRSALQRFPAKLFLFLPNEPSDTTNVFIDGLYVQEGGDTTRPRASWVFRREGTFLSSLWKSRFPAETFPWSVLMDQHENSKPA